MKKMLFIYNPNSGMGLLKPKLSDVLDIFVKGGYEVTVYPTQKYHDAVRKMGEYEEQYDLVACSGGDGTLDEVVTGMMKREKKVPIGYIPAGTTNDFASSLHISKNMLEAADTVVNGVPFACDVGVFNQDYFVYIAAFGLFTDGLEKFDEYYEKGYIDKVVTTNLNYRTPELLSRPYYVEATMTKFLAAIIDCINHDVSTEHVNDPTERIHTLLEKYENLENKEK